MMWDSLVATGDWGGKGVQWLRSYLMPSTEVATSFVYQPLWADSSDPSFFRDLGPVPKLWYFFCSLFIKWHSVHIFEFDY